MNTRGHFDPSSPLFSSELSPGGEIDISIIRTLVLEDDPRARSLITDVAKQHGHQVTVHSSAEDAMREWHQGEDACPFDLIIADLALPGQINGFDFIRWVRAMPECASAAILVITGNRAIADIRDLLHAGADDYQPKPFDASALDVRLTIAEHLICSSRARSRDEHRALAEKERFHEVFEQCPDALLIVSREDGRVLEANHALLSLIGVSPEEARGGFLSLLLPDLFESDDPRISEDVFKSPITLPDVRHTMPDGAILYLDVTVSGAFWGGRTDLLLSFHDTTKRHESETLRLIGAKAESANFLAVGAAQDFGNLFNSIGGNLSLLEKHGGIPSDALALVGGAQRACRTGVDRAGQLLEFGRPSEPEFRPLKLRPMIENAVRLALGSQRSDAQFSFPESLWDILADEGQFAQIIAHLASNADQAMPGGGIIHVSAENISVQAESRIPLERGNYVAIRFSDSGFGIPQENLDRVFDPYFTTRPEGTGLGLTTVASFVKGSRGYIKVDSAPGKGTTFTFFLPASTSPWAAGVTTGAPQDSPSAREPRVLFMDDDAGIRRVVEKMLTKAGFDVFCASDGAEAIEIYRQSIDFETPFDVLLLDLDVPGGIGGVEAIRRIREKSPDVRALVTSGYVDDAVLENHQEFGFCGVITKPFSSQKLISVMESLTGSKSRRAQKG